MIANNRDFLIFSWVVQIGFLDPFFLSFPFPEMGLPFLNCLFFLNLVGCLPLLFLKQRNTLRPAESFADQSLGLNSGSGPALMFSAKFDENNVAVSPNISRNAQNPVESVDLSASTTFKAMDRHPGLTNKVVPIHMQLQPNIFTPVVGGGGLAQLPPRLAPDAENMATLPQPQLWKTRSSVTTECTVASDKLKEQELTIEGGTISISSAYSQG